MYIWVVSVCLSVCISCTQCACRHCCMNVSRADIIPHVDIASCHLQHKGKASASAKLKADEQARRESHDSGRSRIKREKEEHAARGPIPAPCQDFRLPQHQVPTLLMIWELTQVCWAVGVDSRHVMLGSGPGMQPAPNVQAPETPTGCLSTTSLQRND